MSELANAIKILSMAADADIRETAEEIALSFNRKLTIAQAEQMIRRCRANLSTPIPPMLEEFKPIERTWFLYGGFGA